MTAAETKEEKTYRDFLQTYGWAITVALWMLLGGFFIWDSVRDCGSRIGAILMIVYAAFSVTGLLGFMMGMSDAKPDDPPTDKKFPPTNLQKIASWLTQLLLGAGLVELKSIGKRTWAFSETMGGAIAADYGKYVIFSGLIAFSALGILTGYLWSQYHYGNPSAKNNSGPLNGKPEIGNIAGAASPK